MVGKSMPYFLNSIDTQLFSAEPSTVWMCLNCGYIRKGTRVPEVCPTCLEEKGYFIPADLAPYLRGDLIVVY